MLVVAADAEPGLEPLALAGLQRCTAPVLVQRPLDTPGARPAAMAGWGRLRSRGRPGDEGEPLRSPAGQASVLVVGGLVALVLGALVLGLVARGGGREARAQRAADLAALAGARAMHDAYGRLFEPVFADRVRPGPRHLSKARYLALGRAAAERVAAANGARDASVVFPDAASFAPVRVRVTVRDRFEVRTGEARRSAPIEASAEAELAPPDDARRVGRRLRRPARRAPGRADAPRRRPRLRPAGARRARRRRRPADRQRLPLGRRAGDPLRPPSGPALGRPAGTLAAPPRHRARPRPARRLRLARRARRRASTSRSGTRGSRGISATR